MERQMTAKEHLMRNYKPFKHRFLIACTMATGQRGQSKGWPKAILALSPDEDSNDLIQFIGGGYQGLHGECDEAEDFLERLEIDWPYDTGLWVYEQEDIGEVDEEDFNHLNQGEWRRPNKDEWERIIENMCPWEEGRLV